MGHRMVKVRIRLLLFYFGIGFEENLENKNSFNFAGPLDCGKLCVENLGLTIESSVIFSL